jgi:hypothetical protein
MYFTVPQGYFDTLATETLSRIDTVNTEFLADVKNKPVFEVPQGYFEQLAGSILQK